MLGRYKTSARTARGEKDAMEQRRLPARFQCTESRQTQILSVRSQQATERFHPGRKKFRLPGLA
jgi:hypothetical protein